MNFFSKIKKKKPLLLRRQRITRYNWAKKYKSWTVYDWKRVIWTDETKITIWGSDGVTYYLSRSGDPLEAHHLDLTVENGGGSLKMWGCMSWMGVGFGCQIMDRMNAEVYCEVLETSFKDSLKF